MNNKTRVHICYARYPSDLERKINEFLTNLDEENIVNQIIFREPRFEEGSYVAYMVYEPRVCYPYPWLDDTTDNMTLKMKEERYDV